MFKCQEWPFNRKITECLASKPVKGGNWKITKMDAKEERISAHSGAGFPARWSGSGACVLNSGHLPFPTVTHRTPCQLIRLNASSGCLCSEKRHWEQFLNSRQLKLCLQHEKVLWTMTLRLVNSSPKSSGCFFHLVVMFLSDGQRGGNDKQDEICSKKVKHAYKTFVTCQGKIWRFRLLFCIATTHSELRAPHAHFSSLVATTEEKSVPSKLNIGFSLLEWR